MPQQAPTNSSHKPNLSQEQLNQLKNLQEDEQARLFMAICLYIDSQFSEFKQQASQTINQLDKKVEKSQKDLEYARKKLTQAGPKFELITFIAQIIIAATAGGVAALVVVMVLIHQMGSTQVKEWIKSWNTKDLEEVFAREDFYQLTGKQAKKFYYSRLGTGQSKISAASVKEIGSLVSIPVEIVPLGTITGPTKECQRTIDHSEYAAIVILPQETKPHEYTWLGCTDNYPEKTYLGLSLGDEVTNARTVTTNDIELKEVRRGQTQNPNVVEVRITNKLAEHMGITEKQKGFIYVTDAN